MSARALLTGFTVLILGVTTTLAEAKIPWVAYALDCGDLEVTGQALYWRDMRPGNEVAVSAGTDGVSVSHFEQPASEWGGSIEVSYRFLCNSAFLSGRYLWYNSQTSSQITQPTLFSLLLPVLGAPDISSISSNLEEEYRTVTIDAGVQAGRCGRARIWLFGQTRYAKLRSMDQQIVFTVSEGDIVSGQRWSLEGWGPGVGFSGLWQPFCCWLLNGIEIGVHVGVGALIGQVKYAADIPPGPVSLVGFQAFPNNLGAFPNLDLRLGLSYTVRCGCFCLSVQGGYEANYYWNCFQHTTNNTATLNVATPETRSIGFGGPFVGGSISF